MTTNAVGDHEEMLILDQREVVLVVSTLHADVGLCRVSDSHLDGIVADRRRGMKRDSAPRPGSDELRRLYT